MRIMCGTGRLIRSGGSNLDVRSRGSMTSSINGGARATYRNAVTLGSIAGNHLIHNVSAMDTPEGRDSNSSFTNDLGHQQTVTTRTLHGSPPFQVKG